MDQSSGALRMRTPGESEQDPMTRQYLNNYLEPVARAGYPPLSRVSTTYAVPNLRQTAGDPVNSTN